jgi:hypothetical protein
MWAKNGGSSVGILNTLAVSTLVHCHSIYHLLACMHQKSRKPDDEKQVTEHYISPLQSRR